MILLVMVVGRMISLVMIVGRI